MKEVLEYVLGVVACSALFVTFYRTVLHGRVSFGAARGFLLGSLVFAAAIPALEIPVWQSAPIQIPINIVSRPAVQMPVPVADAIVVPIDWLKIALWTLYVAGTLLLVAMMIHQTIKIAGIRRRAEIHKIDGRTIALSGDITAPFSFLSTVYASSTTSTTELHQIITHEGSHIRHHHSAEKIVMETLKAIFWFSPAVWWASRLLDEVHEFQADSDTLAAGCPIDIYLPTIFRQVFGVIPEISTGLGNSLTKKRFEMMKTNLKHSKLSWLRAAGVLPIAVGMLALFSFTHRAPEIVLVGAPEPIETLAEPQELEQLEGEIAKVYQTPAKTVAETPQQPQEPVYTAEEMPTFQGGDLMKFRNWVMSQIHYPQEAMDQNIQGKVVVKYVVGNDGTVANVETLSSPSPLLSDEVVRVINTSPNWFPGKMNGKAVPVYYVLPIDFVLKNDDGQTQQEDIEAYNLSGKKPLYIIDGQEATQADIDQLIPEQIEYIDVLKEASAVEKYGSKAADGVISITTKNPADMRLFIVDGREMNATQWQEYIGDKGKFEAESLVYLTGEDAVERYGERGQNGVTVVTTKNSQKKGNEKLEVGYGQVSRKNNTSSVSQVDMEGAYAYSDLKNYLQGRIPGVQFVDDLLVVRGIGSINAKVEALVLIDGVQINSFADANAYLNPSDVASVTVLKDAGATSIYGSRGANGVVLITTKK